MLAVWYGLYILTFKENKGSLLKGQMLKGFVVGPHGCSGGLWLNIVGCYDSTKSCCLAVSWKTDLNHKYPNAQVTEGNHGNGNKEVDHHHRRGVGTADILGKGAGVHPGVVAQRTDKEVRDNGHYREDPD